MPVEIKVPPLGEAVTEATVGQWFKKPGDTVKEDEPLVELETDKVTVELSAPATGVLAEIKVAPGSTVYIGSTLGFINEGARTATPSKAAEPAPQKGPAPVRPAAHSDNANMSPTPPVRRLIDALGATGAASATASPATPALGDPAKKSASSGSVESIGCKIFINYRRGDDPGFTHALFQRLEHEFAPNSLFFDVDGGSIRPGDDFVETIAEQVAECAIFLAVIGPRWAGLLAARAGDPEDFVVIEIKAALDQKKRVIPVLVGNAIMPRADSMPEMIRQLARRNAAELRPRQFKSDCDALVKVLKDQLAASKSV